MSTVILCFEDELDAANRLGKALDTQVHLIKRHRFPDGELKLTLPTPITEKVLVYRSLVHPNEKLVELLLVAKASRQLGAKDLTLISPYLAYMRQDIAFNEGEVVSQKIVGAFLASLFNSVVTIDPHLHRISKLEEAIAVERPIALSGAPLLGDFIANKIPNAYLIGPDEESKQWVEQAAIAHSLDFAICKKIRHGDKDVDIKLPVTVFRDRNVVLLDDVASSGQTLAKAAKLILDEGAKSVDVAVTHALFAGDAIAAIKLAGVRNIWSTDCIAHESNVIDIAPILAEAILQNVC